MKKYIWLFKGFLLLNLIFIILIAFTDIFKAYVLGKIMDTVSRNASLINLIIICSVFLIFLLVIFVCSDVLFGRMNRKILIKLRSDLIIGILNTSVKDFNKNLSSRYLNALSNDINIIYDDYAQNIKELLYSFVSLILSLIFLFGINIVYGGIIVVLSLIPIIFNKLLVKNIQHLKLNYSNSLSKLVSYSKNVLDGFTVVRSFNIEKIIFKKLNSVSENTENTRYKSKTTERCIQDLNYFIGMLIFILNLLVGAYLVRLHRITIGEMLMATQLSNNVINPLRDFSVLSIKIKSVNGILDKINKIIDIKSRDNYGSYKKNQLDYKIKIEDLFFRYENKEDILRNINIEFLKGKKYAIIGKSGCGKSTLLNILQGFYKDFEGNIFIDDISIKDLDEESISNIISTISQNVYLFNDTIKNNICLYSDYSDDKLNDIIEQSGLNSTISRLEMGLDTIVVENGSNLSGGEKQRISIARALIRDTPVLFLDEATAALDEKTKSEIDENIFKMIDKTIIYITHQVESLHKYNFDEVILMGDKVYKDRELDLKKINLEYKTVN